MINETDTCPCGSAQTFASCCSPYIQGTEPTPTAETLMRSRYTAHVIVDVPYLMKTLHPETRGKFSPESVQSFAEKSDWQKLEIISKEKGTETDTTGVVEFKAYFQDTSGPQIHHEVSSFEKLNQNWFFKGGWYPKAQPKRAAKKVGRNEPCPCGSGKKYKKCCG